MLQVVFYAATLVFIFRQVKIQNRQISIQNKQLKDQVNINIVTILNSLQEQWWSTRMRRARRTVCENHIKTSINVEEEAVLSFFENISLFCEKKMIDPEFIWETYSYYIERYWMILKDNVEKIQETDKSYFNGFIKLKEKMEEITKSKNLAVIKILDKDLTAFRDSEKLCYTPKKTN